MANDTGSSSALPSAEAATATAAAEAAVSTSSVTSVAGEPADVTTIDQDDTVKGMMKMMKSMIENYEKRLDVMQKEIQKKTEKNDDNDDKEKLKPINFKDLKLPSEYDGDSKDYMEWHTRFKALLVNRTGAWGKLLEVVEQFGNKKIKDIEEIKDKLRDKNLDNIEQQIEEYSLQMYTYLGSYTKGNLHARVLKGKDAESFEVYRDIVCKGKNINSHRVINLKASILQPKKANKPDDLDKILADWKYEQKVVTEFDQSELDEEMKRTILMTIMPKDYVEYMRDKFMEEKYKDNYHAFEQELYDRISQKKIDEEQKKGINQLASTQDDKRQENCEKYENVEVWCEDWQCWICGLAPKRGNEDTADDAADPQGQGGKRQKGGSENADGSKGKAKGDGKRGPRVGGPCWQCGGPHFQRECPKGKGKGAPILPIPGAWSTWRPSNFPGPTPQQWRSWMPKKGKSKGKGKGKADGGKGKGQGDGMQEVAWPTMSQLGQLQWQQEDYRFGEVICARLRQAPPPTHWLGPVWRPAVRARERSTM